MHQENSAVARIVNEVDDKADHSAIVARNVKGLPELIEKHDEAVRELEKVVAKYWKSPGKLPAERPRCKTQKGDPNYDVVTKVDAIDYLTARITQLKGDIVKNRQYVDVQKPLSYGFASFESVHDAHKAAFSARKSHPWGTTIQLAPKPSDLIWENLPLDRHRRGWGIIMNNFWVAVLTLVWTVPNALIAVFLANLSNLGSVWPDFQSQLERNPKTWGAIQGILAPLITTLFYLLLPVIFRRLSVFAGEYSRAARERHVTRKLYAFFVFNNLIVFSLFSTAWKYGTSVQNAESTNGDAWSAIVESDPFGNLLTAFCDVSPFWLNYLLQRNFGAALDLSQIIKLAKGYFTRKLLSPTPRELRELSTPPPFDYASYYNNFLFYTTIALVFAPFQPLVLPVTALYFTLDVISKSYLLLYVVSYTSCSIYTNLVTTLLYRYIFITKHESGGAFWSMLVNRLLFATLLSNVVATTFIASRRESVRQIALMVPLLFLIGGFKWYSQLHFESEMGLGLEVTENETARMHTSNDTINARFGHPALYKELMMPMVAEHAKDLVGGTLDAREMVPVPSRWSDLQTDSISARYSLLRGVSIRSTCR
jgi:calcium permeable stress-gated cation channel